MARIARVVAPKGVRYGVPRTKGGKAKLHSYLQTGDAIVPTHYLVDAHGRVQLITMSMVNWALTELKG